MRPFSYIGFLLIGITTIAAFVLIGIQLIGRSSVPEHSADRVEGLGGPVTILRDQNGIAYITAESENDGMAALGYAHAQDRLWQMELARRAGSGRLSEIFGSRALKFDRFLRTVGIGRVASRIISEMPKRTLATLKAYSQGVNAFIDSHQGRFPMEFDALGYQPEHWGPEDCVLTGRMMAWQLNPGLWTDIIFGDIRNRVDSLRFSEMLPYYSPDSPTIIGSGQLPRPLPAAANPVDSLQTRDTTRQPHHAQGLPRNSFRSAGELAGQAVTPAMQIDQELRQFLGMSSSGVGSNAWVISGTRTLSHRPILANDPHLQLRAPAQWYQTVIITRAGTLAGVTIPGTPFIVIGRNRNISWGITSLMGDETDYYIEHLDSAKHRFALHDNKWEPLTIIRDTIRVKDSLPVPLLIRSSIHGPLISDVHPFVAAVDQATGIDRLGRDSLGLLSSSPVAMRWNGMDPSQEFAAWQGINSAKNFSEFRSAVALGGCPSLSFVYADAAGNIGYVPSMRVPIRIGANLPNPGWDGRFDWKGYASASDMPALFNPPSGYIATANNKLSDNLPFHVSDLWEDESRAVRLGQYLGDGKNFTILDVELMQQDVISPSALMMTGYLLRAFPDSSSQGDAVRTAITLLKKWDGGMQPGSPEAAIVNEWIQQVLQMTYRDELGPALYAEFMLASMLPIRALRHHLEINSRWFDDLRTPDKRETRDDILRTAFGKSLEVLNRRFGTWNLSTWRFGTMHTVTLEHAFTGQKSLKNVVDIGPFEVGGTSTTLNKGEWNFNQPYSVRVGPSMRQIVDFSDSVTYLHSIIPTGASGQPMDRFYKNQTTLWLIGGLLDLYQTVPTSAAASSVTNLDPR